MKFRIRRPRFSLRWALSTPFACVGVVMLAVMAYAHYHTIERMSAHEAENLLLATVAHSESELRLLLHTPIHLQAMAAEYIAQAELVQPGDVRGLQTYLHKLFLDVYRRDLRGVDMVQMGTVHGDFIGFSEKLDRGEHRLMHLKDRRTGGRLVVTDLESGAVLRIRDPYDPRLRPWYRPVAQGHKPRWTSLHAASTNPFGVNFSATYPVLARDGRLLGVLSSDISVTSLAQVLSEAPLQRTIASALSFIVDQDGNLVAVSNGSPLTRMDPLTQQPQLRTAANAADQRIARAYQAMRSDAALDSVHRLSVDGAEYAAIGSHFLDPHGIDWLIVAIVPDAELSGASLQNAHLALALALGASLIGLLAGLVVIRRLVAPIRRTAQVASSMSLSDALDSIPPPPDMPSHIIETAQLTQAFGAMAQRIALQLRRLKTIALKDDVTGLLNAHGLVASARWTEPIDTALVAFGVDDYAVVRATLHASADEQLLPAIASRLDSCLPGGVQRARTEGAEFLLLFTGLDVQGLDAALQALQAAFDQPLQAGTDALRLQTSIGLTSARCTGAEVATRLLGEAALALAATRRTRSGAPTRFSPVLFEAASDATRLRVELASAIVDDRLVLHYQPVVDIEAGSAVGVEALVRWPHPEHGLMAPGRFIGLAEESGLIVPLGAWIFERAARDVSALRSALDLPPDFFVNVNVSPRQMRQSDFVQTVQQTLARWSVPACALKIEITESLLLEDDATRQTIAALQDLDIAFALDDFGAGYSSLAYLTRLRFHTIKADRSLLLAAGESESGRMILAAAADLARALRALCVVEGVEDDAQLALLRSMGLQFAQGFRFAHPMPLDELRQLLARQIHAAREPLAQGPYSTL